jgi:hypothetical protein
MVIIFHQSLQIDRFRIDWLDIGVLLKVPKSRWHVRISIFRGFRASYDLGICI